MKNKRNDTISSVEDRKATKNKDRDQPLNILFVQEAPCIRNYKMATALRSAGHHVTLAYQKARLSQMYKGLDDGVYNASIRLQGIRHLWDLSKSFDIVHCHNEPDVLTVAAIAGDAPVIHDTHDLISLRSSGDQNLSYFEGVANRGAAGRIYTTAYQQDEAKRLYGVEGPSIVFHNYASRSDLPQKYLPKLSKNDGCVHIVYEGGIGGNTHRDFNQLFFELGKKGIHIHIYPTFYDKHMADLFSNHELIHYYQPVSPKQIIQEMTQYDFGIIPFNLEKGNKRFLDSTIANKLYEYQAAGLPTIASPLKSYVEYFIENPVGITFGDGSEIISKIPELRNISKKVNFSERIFTYESEINRIISFYNSIIYKKSKNNFRTPPNEDQNAKQYWKNRGIISSYFKEGRQSATIVQTIKYLKQTNNINRILEFGCNVGRNLNCVRRDIPGIEVMGLDINKEAVNLGKKTYGLPLFIGGEEKLKPMLSGSFDVVFTVSVLDHIPEVESIIKELLRVAKYYFIAIEPYIGVNENAKDYAIADYSYFWDYPELFQRLGGELIHDKPCPLPNSGLGPFYRLYVVKPNRQSNYSEAQKKVNKNRQVKMNSSGSSDYSEWLSAMVNKNSNFLTADEVINGEKIKSSQPNVVIRHDIDFSPPLALKMAQTEKKLGAKSTFYSFTPDKYKFEFPIIEFQKFEKEGWEIGYHTSTENIDEALADIQKLREFFKIRTTVPHMGNLTICKGELKRHIRVLRDGQRFLVQDDGYIADNGGRLQMRVKVKDNGINKWKPLSHAEILESIEGMENGKVYHFLFHPCWYNEQLKFIGNKMFHKNQNHEYSHDFDFNPSNNRAIFIGGTGRSGTTLLREILDSHPEITAIPFETKLISQKIFRDFPDALATCPPNLKTRMIEKFKQLWVDDFYRFKVGWSLDSNDNQFRGLHKWIDKKDIVRYFSILDNLHKNIDENQIYIIIGRFINSIFSSYKNKKDAKYWVEKTPMNSAYATFWYRCFPNLKIINIIRDGRDVACSLRNVVWGIKDYKNGVDWWVDNLSQALREQRYLPQNSYLNVKYEDLVFNKIETLKNIVDFLNIDWSDSLNSIEVSKESVGRWKNELPEHVFDYINQKHHKLFKFLGYDLKEKPIHKSKIHNYSDDKQYYLDHIKNRSNDVDIQVWDIDTDNFPYVKMKNGLIFYGKPIQDSVSKEGTFDYETEFLKQICFIIEDIKFRYLRKREIIQDSNYLIQPGDTVVEVGAYFGYYSMYLSGKVGTDGKVYAIELIPDSYEVLKKNLEANFRGIAHAINIGIDNRIGESNAYSGGRQISSLRKDVVAKYKQDYDRVPVKVSTMDNILNQYNLDRIDFMTIQINGTEIEALQGMQRSIQSVKNFAIAAPYGKNGRDNVHLVSNILTENGFEVSIDKTMVYAKNQKYYE